MNNHFNIEIYITLSINNNEKMIFKEMKIKEIKRIVRSMFESSKNATE